MPLVMNPTLVALDFCVSWMLYLVSYKERVKRTATAMQVWRKGTSVLFCYCN